jgi:hypothetical protein
MYPARVGPCAAPRPRTSGICAGATKPTYRVASRVITTMVSTACPAATTSPGSVFRPQTSSRTSRNEAAANSAAAHAANPSNAVGREVMCQPRGCAHNAWPAWDGS